jgi:hypothetical protein
MPFEGVVCPDDGATEGITQVEPDTYYCAYHKGLFKFVDPRKITVRVEGVYCPCGNQAKFQCQLCKGGTCEECDVIEWRQRTRRQPGGRRAVYGSYVIADLAVMMEDFGYVQRSNGVPKNGVVGGRIKEVQVGRPFLFETDIWPHLGVDPDDVRHMCCHCLTAGVVATAEAIATGRQCEHPACGNTSGRRCPCCRGAFCSEHIGDLGAGRIGQSFRRSNPGTVTYFELPRELWTELCGMCREHNRAQARNAIKGLAGSNRNLYYDQRNGYGAKTSVGLKERAILKQFEEGVHGMLRRMVDNSATCTRSQYFDKYEPQGPEGNLAAVCIYKVVDERSGIAPRLV